MTSVRGTRTPNSHTDRVARRQTEHHRPPAHDPATPLGTQVQLKVSYDGVKVRISGTVTAINHDDNGRISYTITRTPVGEGDGHTYMSL